MRLETQHDLKNEAQITYWNSAGAIGPNVSNLRTLSWLRCAQHWSGRRSGQASMWSISAAVRCEFH